MSAESLDARLGSVAALVRQGAVLADIGTDHAYLPLFLLRTGRISSAFCCDVAEGPLARARENAAATPYADRIRFVLTNGLCGLESEDIDDITVCGMGGELICSILEAAPFVRDERYRLILQPMTKQEHLRAYLYANGFHIEKEVYSEAEGKVYVAMLVSYDGRVREVTSAEALMGTVDKIDPGDKAQAAYFANKRRTLLAAAQGKMRGGQDASEEEMLMSAIDRAFLNDNK